MRRSAHRLFAGVIGCALLAASAGCRDRGPLDEAGIEAAAPQAEPLDPALVASLPEGVSADLVQEGQRHFTVCLVCHGPDGRGTQLGPSLRDGEWIHIDGSQEQIAEIVRAGIPTPTEYPVPMPEMGGGDFTEDQLRALATYVYALGRAGS